MIKPALVALLLTAASVAVHSQLASKPNRTVQTYSVPEAYEVYSAILPSEWTWQQPASNRLLIKAETVSYQMCLTPDAKSAKLLAPAIDHFKRLNQQTWHLDSLFEIGKPYDLIAPDVLSAPFQGRNPGGWEQFDREHPNSVGWIEFSAVGFNEDKTVAVVYVGHYCGGLCGGGHYEVLHKSAGKWKPLHWNGGSCAWAS